MRYRDRFGSHALQPDLAEHGLDLRGRGIERIFLELEVVGIRIGIPIAPSDSGSGHQVHSITSTLMVAAIERSTANPPWVGRQVLRSRSVARESPRQQSALQGDA